MNERTSMKTCTTMNGDSKMEKPLDKLPRGWPSLILVLVFASLILAGCAGEKRPDPTYVDLMLTASPAVNPDRNGRASPVLVRVYELRSAGTFETADFFVLLEQDQTALGAELVNRWEFQLDPGQTTRLEANFQPSSSALGILAAYRDIEQAQWRAVSPLEISSENELTAMIGRLDVNLGPRDD